jgi:hypothetical protein
VTKGFVYMVQFREHKNCYKIGSSIDPLARINTLSGTFGHLKLVLCGESNNHLKSERYIQHKLSNHCNRYLVYCGNSKLPIIDFVGSKVSREQFILDDNGVIEAIQIFRKNCDIIYDALFKPVKQNTPDMEIATLMKGWGEA